MEVEKISKKRVDRKMSTHAWLKHFTQSCNNRELIDGRLSLLLAAKDCSPLGS